MDQSAPRRPARRGDGAKRAAARRDGRPYRRRPALRHPRPSAAAGRTADRERADQALLGEPRAGARSVAASRRRRADRACAASRRDCSAAVAARHRANCSRSGSRWRRSPRASPRNRRTRRRRARFVEEIAMIFADAPRRMETYLDENAAFHAADAEPRRQQAIAGAVGAPAPDADHGPGRRRADGRSDAALRSASTARSPRRSSTATAPRRPRRCAPISNAPQRWRSPAAKPTSNRRRRCDYLHPPPSRRAATIDPSTRSGASNMAWWPQSASSAVDHDLSLLQAA